MRQVLQYVDGGGVDIRDVPAPICGAREVLIATQASLVSAGTERMILDLARKSLLGKARERPDQVRRVLRKAKEEGLIETFRQVRTKLAEPMAIGYSGAGVVMEVGRDVRRFRPGQAVAAAGAHAELMVVPQNLVARLPGGVPWPDAAYGVVGSIALHGIRLARVGLGDRVAVIGLGLVGQLAVQLLRTSGCVVFGTDPNPDRQRLAADAGAVVAFADGLAAPIGEWTDGRGVDAVVITAATASNQPLELAAAVARKKARIVAVGAVGLAVPRREFYEKELELVVSSSYGPGRYDPDYEQRGQDYPAAYVRWTSQRNIEAVLEKIAAGSLDVKRLTTHSFPIAEAAAAYEVLARNEAESLGIVLTYGEVPAGLRPAAPVDLRATPGPGRNALGIGVIGAGNFASVVLLPRLEQAPGVRLRVITSAKGVTAADRGARHGFERAVSSADEVLADEDVNVVFIATRHDNHASLALSALRRQKAVFVEKPLAIETAALGEFEIGLEDLGPEIPLWMVGFNRRFSRAARTAADFLASAPGPKTLHYRFNAGRVPAGHWTEDPEVGGGRFVGEACHALELTCFLLRAQITRVFAEAVARGGGMAEDETSVIARLDDGSVATILYSSNGDRGMPKERIEVLGGGRFAVIDDFDAVTLSVDGRARTRRMGARDKGHSGAVDAFLEAARAGGPPPIAYGTLLNVSWATLAAMESLRTGLPVEVRTYRPVAE